MNKAHEFLKMISVLIAFILTCAAGALLFFRTSFFAWDWEEAPIGSKINVLLIHGWSAVVIISIAAIAIFSAIKVSKRASVFWLLAPFISLALLLADRSIFHQILERF